MDKSQAIRLFEYNSWANWRILASASACSPEQFLAPAACSFGSLRGTLVHIYSAEWIWRSRLQFSKSPAALPSEKEFLTLETFQVAWTAEMDAMRDFLDKLSDARTQEEMQYTNTKGVTFTSPVWQILIHLVNHGTQFRSEAGMILSNWGYSPGDIDMIFYFRGS